MKLVYDEVVEILGDPMRRKPDVEITKRAKGKAWRVTNKVWQDICQQMGTDDSGSIPATGRRQPGGVVEASD